MVCVEMTHIMCVEMTHIILKRVPKRRKRPKMAILPVGKTQKQGEGNVVLNTSQEWVVIATRLSLKRVCQLLRIIRVDKLVGGAPPQEASAQCESFGGPEQVPEGPSLVQTAT
jgi:hypothetical protein